MEIDQLRVFVKVVQAGSFTRAADILNAQKSHLSRSVTQLEGRLGVKLLERTTRSLGLTEVGKEIYERAVGILAAVEDTERLAQNITGEPRGTLRLTCGVEFGLIAVNGWIDTYLAEHQRASVEVEFTSRVLDLVHEGFDLAIRVGPLQESRLAARKLGELEYGLFACPRYIERRGMPDSCEALKGHDLLMFTAGSHRAGWRLQRDAEVAKVDAVARLKVNNCFAVRDAILNSLGIGVLPLIVAREAVDAGRMVLVLPDWAPLPAPVHAVFPGNRYLTPKVRAFVDLALEHFPRIGDPADWRRRAAACPAPAG